MVATDPGHPELHVGEFCTECAPVLTRGLLAVYKGLLVIYKGFTSNLQGVYSLFTRGLLVIYKGSTSVFTRGSLVICKVHG